MRTKKVSPKVYSLADSADQAVETFKVFSDERPVLVPTGIRTVDNAIGGLGPGTGLIIAAATGVGKSSLALHAALNNAQDGVPTGIISLEDGPDVLGCRVLAWASGVSSLDIRKGTLTPKDIQAVQEGYEVLQGMEWPSIAYCVGRPIDDVEEAMRALCRAGCKCIWVDYIQKVRGGSQDRRNEVASTFTRLQRVAFDHGVVPMFVSQLSRSPDPGRPPTIHMLKESGDLENEARVILLLWGDLKEPRRLYLQVGKSTFGGDFTKTVFTRDRSGHLVEMRDDEY